MNQPLPPNEDLRRLASRVVALGAIPIAVFCGAFALARAALGTGETGQMLTWILALAAAVASVFVVARRTAGVLEADIRVIRLAMRHGGKTAEGGELPELEPPLESLKREVLRLANDFQSRELQFYRDSLCLHLVSFPLLTCSSARAERSHG